jgi:cytidine deaminase
VDLTTPPISDPDLISRAQQAFQQAYAPYSNYRVGAALLTARGTLLIGCNVEDATMNMGVCAERAAIINAVIAEGPKMRIRTLAVVAETSGPCAPCGNCRQLFSEFAQDNARFIFDDGDGYESHELGEVLPFTYKLKATART